MYQLSKYLEDDMLSALKEKCDYMGISFEEDAKEVYKINYYLRDNLQIPIVKPVLEKQRNRNNIALYVSKFIDEHSQYLSTAGPIYIFTFGNKEIQPLYDLFNITADQLYNLYTKMIEETFYGQISSFFNGWVKNAPHKILLTAMSIEAIQNNYPEIIECCKYLWAFSEYAILYRKFWSIGVKPDVMNYTIEHIGAKFKIKKVSNLQGLFKYDADVVYKLMEPRLKEGVDNVYTDFMYRFRNQMKNTFGNISKVYYANDKKNSTQHTNIDSFEDGQLVDQDGFTSNMAQIIDNTVTKILNAEPMTSIIKVVSEAAEIDKANVTSYIKQIYASKNNQIDQFITSIITYYFSKNPDADDLNSSEFLNFGLAAYRSLPRSKDELLLRVNQIMGHWMNDIINIHQFYKRDATIIAYSRAIFNYFIMMINHVN